MEGRRSEGRGTEMLSGGNTINDAQRLFHIFTWGSSPSQGPTKGHREQI